MFFSIGFRLYIFLFIFLHFSSILKSDEHLCNSWSLVFNFFSNCRTWCNRILSFAKWSISWRFSWLKEVVSLLKRMFRNYKSNTLYSRVSTKPPLFSVYFLIVFVFSSWLSQNVLNILPNPLKCYWKIN